MDEEKKGKEEKDSHLEGFSTFVEIFHLFKLREFGNFVPTDECVFQATVKEPFLVLD